MQIGDYQSVSDEFFAILYYWALVLKGYDPISLKVKSEKPLISDQLKEEQTETAKITNVTSKRDNGFISQDQAAQELGYEKALDSKYVKPDPMAAKQLPTTPEKDAAKTANNIAYYERQFNVEVPEFDYTVGKCGSDKETQFGSDFGDDKTNELANRYIRQVEKTYKSATKKISLAISEKFKYYNDTTPLETIQNDVYLVILRRWEQDFVIPTRDIINDNIEKIYSYFRKDKKIFNKTQTSSNQHAQFKGSSVVDAIFSLQDYRTIDYVEKNDTMYLGKFIVDENNLILAGDKRVYALEELDYAEVTVKQVFNLTEAQKDEFIVKDNIHNGEWDSDIIANQFDPQKLKDWGVPQFKLGGDLGGGEKEKSYKNHEVTCPNCGEHFELSESTE